MTRFLFLLAVFVFSLFGNAAANEPIGRLFLTPAERARLDQLRFGVKDISAVDKTTEPTVQTGEQITLDGFVRRSSGKGTTWINQVPQNEQTPAQGITVLQQLSRPPVISLQLGSGKKLDLKAGQTFDIPTGKVREAYEPAPASDAKLSVQEKPAADTAPPAAKR